MRLLTGEAFDSLFRTFARTAFHLEVQDTYETSEESEPLRLFLELNIAAGEDIRWLPRHQAEGIELPLDDFWLFDDERVVFTIFEPSGQFAGGAEITDPYIVERCRSVHQQVWQRAIPHAAYVTT
jgi:hypothetical protein